MKKIRYYLLVGSVLSINSLNSTQHTSTFEWRYGLGLSAEFASIDVDVEIKPENTSGGLGTIGIDCQQTAKKMQFAPILEFGAFYLNKYYLGLHLTWRATNAKANSKTGIRSAKYEEYNQFKLNSFTNIFLKPGYKLSDGIMVYGLMGPSIANWTHNTRFIPTDNLAWVPSNIAGQVSNSDNVFTIRKKTIGFGLGAGFECLMSKNSSISFDYVYHKHKSIKGTQKMAYYLNTGTPGAPSRVQSGNMTKTIQPSYSTLAVRFTYFF